MHNACTTTQYLRAERLQVSFLSQLPNLCIRRITWDARSLALPRRVVDGLLRLRMRTRLRLSLDRFVCLARTLRRGVLLDAAPHRRIERGRTLQYDAAFTWPCACAVRVTE
eukprot:6081661-Pleurochrysis_carterae.AAC.2